ncbi:auxin efflux carrier [Kalaharituber pfeilii]|nr:auxin efflux carrier [Kalaharituber pfeilii]
MSPQPAPLAVSFVGALQASLSVILTLGYGLLAARFGLIRNASAKDVSRLCVNIFLPMLIVTNVGSQIDVKSIKKYFLIMVWSTAYTILSIGYGAIFVRFLRFPSWTTPACSFNNTTSLPLLLLQSLAVTGLLDNIAEGNVSEAVERATSYFLINSMLSNGLTFAFGPKLLEENDGNSSNDLYGDGAEPHDTGDEESGHRAEASESTSLIPSKIRKPVSTTYERMRKRSCNILSRLPSPIKRTLTFIYSVINAPLIGAVIALIVGLIPPLHRILFNHMQNGGWLRAWFTSSLKNVGELFTSLQMFVVGTELNTSLERGNQTSAYSGYTAIPKRCLLVIYLLRFALWPVISIAIIYLLATKQLLSNDPILWFSMMIMPCGPPAIILSSLAELRGSSSTKAQVAKLLLISYTITPVICLTVVGALKASERAMPE